MSDLRAKAKKLLDANTISASRDGREFRFAVPTSDSDVNSYRIPKLQWTGWDSQFHAIVYAALGEPERACDELKSIFANQRDDGFIPHVSFWGSKNLPAWAYLESKGRLGRLPGLRPTSTEQIQPPALAEAVWRLYTANPEAAAQFLRPAYQYYLWLSENRDFDKDGLISVISQSETGLDYSPAYDAVIGYQHGQPSAYLNRASWRIRQFNKWLWNFNLERILKHSPYHVKDILVNSIYIKNLKILARLANVTRETKIADWAKTKAERGLRTLMDKSFDTETGLFWNLRATEEEQIRVKTIGSLMPLIIPDLPGDITERLVEHLTNPYEFWTKYPVPSTALSEPTFTPFTPDSKIDGELKIWRGPLSMNTNWFLVHGLRAHAYDDIADEIAKKSRALVEKHGFNEFYNPLTGEPCGADKFGWATLVVDM